MIPKVIDVLTEVDRQFRLKPKKLYVVILNYFGVKSKFK